MVAFPAWYALVVGFGMIAQWVFFLITGQVPELQTEPIRISFHLAGKVITALALIAGGVGLLSHKRWGRDITLLGNGLLIYTAVVSPGYFAQNGDWSLVVMFAVILGLSLVSVAVLLRAGRARPAGA